MLALLSFVLPLTYGQDVLLDIQGHRGARGLKPENTLPSFETALDLGVNTLELDLHLTRDHVVVVWHDDRITNDKCYLMGDVDAPNPDSLIYQGDKLLISQLTWEQVQAYRCDRNPDPAQFAEQSTTPTVIAGDNYGIPSLAMVFDFVEQYSRSEEKTQAQRANAADIRFNIETKRKPDNPKAIDDGFDGETLGIFEQEILNIIDTHHLFDQVIIQSFDHRSLQVIHQENLPITLAALTTRYIPDFALLIEQGASIWSPNYRDLTPDLINEAHSIGLRVIPWTVNERETMDMLIAWGIDGIITDYPNHLLE